MNDFKITLFTNQGGIANGKTKSSDFKWKIEQIVRSLNVPVQVFIAAGNSIYRKPLPGMWNYLIQHVWNIIKLFNILRFLKETILNNFTRMLMKLTKIRFEVKMC